METTKTTETSNTFLLHCKGIAVVIAAVSGLTLGVLNWFKEVHDPRAKVGYQESAKQVEALSRDVRTLVNTVQQQAEEISTIQNWIIYERDRRGAQPSPTLLKLQKQKLSRPHVAQPPIRRLNTWDALPTQSVQHIPGT